MSDHSIKFCCPRWGMESLSLRDTFIRIKEAGYDGIEAVVREDEAEEFVSLVEEFELIFIGLYADIIPGKLNDGTLEHYQQKITGDRYIFLRALLFDAKIIN